MPNDSSGRPKVPFSIASEKTKRRKTEMLRKSITTPTRALKILNAYHKSVSLNKILPYSEDEALASVMNTKLTKSQYTLIRLQAKNKNAYLYPPYNNVREAKFRCYPLPWKKKYNSISETCAEVKLQGLLDHTVRQIIQSLNHSNSSVFENQSLMSINS